MACRVPKTYDSVSRQAPTHSLNLAMKEAAEDDADDSCASMVLRFDMVRHCFYTAPQLVLRSVSFLGFWECKGLQHAIEKFDFVVLDDVAFSLCSVLIRFRRSVLRNKALITCTLLTPLESTRTGCRSASPPTWMSRPSPATARAALPA